MQKVRRSLLLACAMRYNTRMIGMHSLRVGVLRGGPSPEYEVSLATGKNVLENLSDAFSPEDIFIDKAGVWHIAGVPVSPADAAERIDVAFNALHGAYGEDGALARELFALGVPHTGARAFGCAAAMNKIIAKEAARAAGVKTPSFVVVSRDDFSDEKAVDIFRSFPQPSVIKPAAAGSSFGVTIARDFPSLCAGIAEALRFSEKAVVEEYIAGKEASCGVVDDFRGEDIYALPPIEIRPPHGKEFFDYEAKYAGETEEICPGDFTAEEKREMERAAKAVHEACGLRHYSRSDFIVSPRGVYFLEVNALPGLSSASLFPKALDAVGASFADFLTHVVSLAAEGK